MRLSSLRFILSIVLSLAALGASTRATAAGPTLAGAPTGLTLKASPPIADVGFNVSFELTAKSWPGPVTATVSFLSAHHGFTGGVVWTGSCSCFRLAVSLAKRIHALEPAKAVATVLFHKRSFTARTTFLIRGLAPNGRDYSPGGAPALRAWVSDPQPNAGEIQHYCAWVATADGLGVPGFAIRFVVHVGAKVERWSAGTSGKSGIVCSHKSVGNPPAGTKVQVDAYAGNLHATAKFVSR